MDCGRHPGLGYRRLIDEGFAKQEADLNDFARRHQALRLRKPSPSCKPLRLAGSFATWGADGKPLRLIEGDELLRMLNAMNPLTPAVETYAAPLSVPCLVPAVANAAPICPHCQVTMVRRVAAKGPRPGEAFWGCRNYPRCREISKMQPNQRTSRD